MEGGHGAAHTNGADALIASFRAWAAAERAGRAAGDRSRERWLRQQATETATLIGVLVDLAERRAGVTLATGGEVVTGRLTGVGTDAALVVAERSGAPTVVAVDHVSSVRVAEGDRDTTGDRPAPGDWGLRDVLEAFGAERLPVRLAPSGGEPLSGVIVGVGADVCTLRQRSGGATVHVPLRAVGTVTGL